MISRARGRFFSARAMRKASRVRLVSPPRWGASSGREGAVASPWRRGGKASSTDAALIHALADDAVIAFFPELALGIAPRRELGPHPLTVLAQHLAHRLRSAQ